jgi:hypothetical protein
MSSSIHGALRTRRARIVHTLLNTDRPDGYAVLKVTRVLPALRRAERKVLQGSYGTCDGCDEPIGEERLKAAPGAVNCVTCQVLYEKTIP